MYQTNLKGTVVSSNSEGSNRSGGTSATEKVDRVQELKQKIQNGTYQLDMSKVAKVLAEEII